MAGIDGTTKILDSVKKLLNINEEDHEFDMDVQAHVNGAFFSLYQLGIGPSTPFYINGNTTWNEFITVVPKDVVLDYIHLKTALVFDPPSSSYVVEAYRDRLSELGFYMNVLVDNGGGNVTG